MPNEEVDLNRYYYRPGTTEPELRPEFVEPAPAPAPKPKATAKVLKPKKANVSKKASKKK